jgi:hypothetical protein
MHNQTDLFSRFHTQTSARQGKLIDEDGHGRESCLSCPHCQRPLVETPGGLLTCPKGHLKLVEPTTESRDFEEMFGQSAVDHFDAHREE